MPSELPVGAWASVIGRPRVAELPAATNPVWEVTSEGGRSYLLKRLPEHPPGVGPVEEYRVSLHLQANGVPVAVPLVTDSGHISTSHEGHSYTLVPRLPADRHDRFGAAGTHAAIGSAIAGLHAALKTYPGPIHSFTHDLVPEFRISLAALPADLVDDTIAPLQVQILAAISDLPGQRIHGDCNPGNVLLVGGEVTGLIDLDHLPLGPRVYDVAYFMVWRLQDLLDENLADDNRTTRFLDALAECVAGYQSASRFSDREITSIGPAMIAAAMTLADWHRREGSYDADKYRRNAAAIRWCCAHFDEINSSPLQEQS
jgi:Ser/Thr protein kinase RdoA (MazF antagonist)